MQDLQERYIFKSLQSTLLKFNFLWKMMLNKIKTPQSLFLAKECDKLWLQHAVNLHQNCKNA